MLGLGGARVYSCRTFLAAWFEVDLWCDLQFSSAAASKLCSTVGLSAGHACPWVEEVSKPTGEFYFFACFLAWTFVELVISSCLENAETG